MLEYSAPRIALLAVTAVAAAACIETRPPPELLPQAQVSYGGNVFLRDDTRGSGDDGPCQTFTASISSSTSTVGPPTQPQNCFIRIESGDLRVDVFETTNELYQLCVDSDACKKPDPSKATKDQICNVESEFDTCPVVEVTRQQASNFCAWIGRRLPTEIEHIIVRQAGITDLSDPNNFPDFASGETAPASCDDAILKESGCLKPRPVTLGEPLTGAASRDVVNGVDPNDPGTPRAIFDLTGNVSEWAADLHVKQIVPDDSPFQFTIPWFCSGPLQAILQSGMFSAANPPVCMPEQRCVHGYYKPAADLAPGIYPVCVIPETARFDGSIGALMGGSYGSEGSDRDERREQYGIFGRRTDDAPEELLDTQSAREYGFRCVDDRESADASGNVRDFDTLHVLDVTP